MHTCIQDAKEQKAMEKKVKKKPAGSVMKRPSVAMNKARVLVDALRKSLMLVKFEIVVLQQNVAFVR